MFEANLTWADGALRLSGKGVPADLEQPLLATPTLFAWVAGHVARILVCPMG